MKKNSLVCLIFVFLSCQNDSDYKSSCQETFELIFPFEIEVLESSTIETPTITDFIYMNETSSYCLGISEIQNQYLCLYHSTDQASGWQKVEIDENFPILRKYVTNNNEIFLTAFDHTHQIARTLDNGVSWQYFQTPDTNAYVTDIVFDDMHNLYALEYNFDEGTSRIIKSTIDEIDWEVIYVSDIQGTLKNSLSLDIADDQLFFSEKDFTISVLNLEGIKTNSIQGQDSHIFDIYVHSIDNIIISDERGMNISTNQGSSWRTIGIFAPQLLYHSKTRIIVTDRTLRCDEKTIQEIKLTKDNGTNWSTSEMISSEDFYFNKIYKVEDETFITFIRNKKYIFKIE